MLNENLEFNDAAAEVKRAFNGVPEKILLPSRVRLYKRTDQPLIRSRKPDEKDISAWWCFVEDTRLPSGKVANGLYATRIFANRLGKSHRDYMRVRAAVSENFPNSMMHLLVVELNAPVWAFAGVASGQKEFKDAELSHIFLIGGLYQLWVPNLSVTSVSEVRSAI